MEFAVEIATLIMLVAGFIAWRNYGIYVSKHNRVIVEKKGACISKLSSFYAVWDGEEPTVKEVGEARKKAKEWFDLFIKCLIVVVILLFIIIYNKNSDNFYVLCGQFSIAGFALSWLGVWNTYSNMKRAKKEDDFFTINIPGKKEMNRVEYLLKVNAEKEKRLREYLAKKEKQLVKLETSRIFFGILSVILFVKIFIV